MLFVFFVFFCSKKFFSWISFIFLDDNSHRVYSGSTPPEKFSEEPKTASVFPKLPDYFNVVQQINWNHLNQKLRQYFQSQSSPYKKLTHAWSESRVRGKASNSDRRVRDRTPCVFMCVQYILCWQNGVVKLQHYPLMLWNFRT